MQIDPPWYLDWTFWTAFFALLAIVLSQLPPVHVLLKKAKLRLEIYSKVHLTHKVGNPNLQFHLMFTNIGGRAVRVQNVTVSLSRDGKHLGVYPIQNFFQNQNDKDTLLFTTFSLQPGGEWAHIANFLNFFDREDNRRYFRIEEGMKLDLSKKKKVVQKADHEQTEENNLIEHDTQLVDAALTFHNKYFCWLPGEYHMSIEVFTEPESACVSKNYRFTIFESHTETLAEIAKFYKYGGGIYWTPSIITGVVLELSEA